MTQQAKIERAVTEQPVTAPKPAPIATLTAKPGGPAIRAAVDRSGSVGRGGSIGLVLLVAALLVAAAAAIVLSGAGNAEPYILAFLAVLATIGVFSLFAFACGLLRVSAADSGNPLIKALVDGASAAIVVTDRDGRVVYANAAYLDLTDAAGAHDMR